MSVLMVNPNRFKPHVSPLGLEYVCNSLIREGIPFEVIDFNFQSESELLARLKSGRVRYVGISMRNVDSSHLLGNEYFVPGYRRLIERIKNTSDCIVVIGGAGYTLFPRQLLEYTGADYGVAGYGEEALPRLIKALESGGDLGAIGNLVWRNEGRVQLNRRSKTGFEHLPARRRHIVRNRDYYGVFGVGNIEAKRGCYMKCGYCGEPGLVGRNIVYNSIGNIGTELAELCSLGIRNIHFCDSELNVGDIDFVSRLCEMILRRELKLTWSASVHPDRDFPISLLKLMRKSGCTDLILNIDSGSDDILADMDKGHSVEDSIIMSSNIRKAQITAVQGYIVGWPGESQQTLRNTVDLLKKTAPDLAYFFVGVRVHPKTKIARLAKQEGQFTTDDELLEPVFYNAREVVEEFYPYLRSLTRQVPNCIIQNSRRTLNRFLSQMIQNVYRSGYRGSLSGVVRHMKGISWLRKFDIMRQTTLDCLIPGRCRFIPEHDG